MSEFRTGDDVLITCGQMTVCGTVVLASENGNSLMLRFEAILDGHVGMVPVLRRNGAYRSIVNGVEVGIKHARLH